MPYHLNNISKQVSQIASAIFFVNLFAYGRVFFATVLATRISHTAVVALSFSMSFMTVINMVVFGILSIIGMDLLKADKEGHVYDRYIAKYFKVSVLLLGMILLFIAGLITVFSYKLNNLTIDFILLYAIGFIPFVFSSAIRYVLLASSSSYGGIIKLTNIVTFIICVAVSLLCFYWYNNLSILSFALGCIVGFTYNFIHLAYFSFKNNVVERKFFNELKKVSLASCVSFIYEGCKVALVYASDSIVCALIIVLTLSYGSEYVVSTQVALQLFLFSSFWTAGFSNGIMVSLSKYQSILSSRKSLMTILLYVARQAMKYWLIVGVLLLLFSGLILHDVFNLYGATYQAAHIETYFVIILVLFDFVRQSFFYILRIFGQVNYAIIISYCTFFVATVVMIILKFLGEIPELFLLIYAFACLAIAVFNFRKLYFSNFSRV